MCKKIGVGFLVAVFMLGMQAPVTHANEVDDALQRMDELLKEMLQLRLTLQRLTTTTTVATPSVLGVASSNDPVFTMSLNYGETNNDIRRIQKLLATDSVIYPYGVASGFFGPKTEEAIRNLQTKFDLKPVGAIGPATTALLEKFFRAYPDENFPATALSAVPTVQGVSTSASTADSVLANVIAQVQAAQGSSVTSANTSNSSTLVITVDVDDEEGEVFIVHPDGSKEKMTVEGDSEAEMIEAIVDLTDDLTKAEIKAAIRFKGDELDEGDDDEEDDEEKAEDDIDDADDEIADAREEIEEADDDGDDVDWAEDTLEEAEDELEEAEEAYDDEDWEEASDRAKEAEELAELAVDRIDEEKTGDEDGDDIDSIEVEVDEDESEVTVEFKDSDKSDQVFDVDEDKIEHIIDKVADELDLDEDVVEDLIEFDFGSVSYIDLRDEDDGESLVIVYYTSGVDRRFDIDYSSDEDDMIEDIADEIDEDEDDIEDWLD